MKKRTLIVIAFIASLSLFPGKSIFSGRAAAAAKQKDALTVHYHRPEADYENWTLWTWGEPGAVDAKEVRPSARDEFGLVFHLDTGLYGGTEAIGLLPKFGEWHGKDDPDRRVLRKGGEIFLVAGDPRVHDRKPDIAPFVVSAFLDSARTIAVTLSNARRPDAVPENFFKVTLLTAKRKKLKVVGASGIRSDRGLIRHFVIELAEELPLDPAALNRVEVAADGVLPTVAHPRHILDDPRFVWNGPLGCTVGTGETQFHLFAPDADRVELLLYDRPDPRSARVIPMGYLERGVHAVSLNRKLSGNWYRYRVHRRGASLDILDPYSQCNTAYDGLCRILDPAAYDKVAAGPPLAPKDAIVYEIHVRDFTSDPAAGVKSHGTFDGFVQPGATLAHHPDTPVGLDHLKELGVTVVQVLPLQNFAQAGDREGYNWGYMPAHYFAPHGWFASNPDDDSRVRECRAMVDALHRNGFKVVLDVVYNHTAEGSGHALSFLGAAPWYYYRTDFEGRFENGSGCGNEFRTEAPMARRLVLDSLLHWVEFYGIDGFRFDLWGLMDFGTIDQLARELRQVKPDILIWGEPWAGGSTSFRIHGKGMQRGQGFAVFNDGFRDSLKGSVWNLEMGYVQSGAFKERVMKGIEGSINDFTLAPPESMNYIDCHDNHTFYDRLKASTAADRETMTAMTKLGAAVLLTSQGIPFLHGGQELMRSKGGSHNSYDQPDSVNMVRWENKRKYRDVVEYYRGLVALRKAHPMFRLATADEVRRQLKFVDRDLGRRLPGSVIAYHLDAGASGDPWNEALVAFNPHTTEVTLPLAGKGWLIALDGDGIYPEGRKEKGKPLGGQATLAPRSALVLFRKVAEAEEKAPAGEPDPAKGKAAPAKAAPEPEKSEKPRK